MLQDRCRSSSGAAGSGGRYISSARRSVPSTAAGACRIWSVSPQSQELSPSVGLPSLRGLSYLSAITMGTGLPLCSPAVTMGTGLPLCSPAVTMGTGLPLCSPAVTMGTGLPLCSAAVTMGTGLPLCRHYGDWFTSLPSLWGLGYLSVACRHYEDWFTSL